MYLSREPDSVQGLQRTVLFINYDEEGGFFDHMVPPTEHGFVHSAFFKTGP